MTTVVNKIVDAFNAFVQWAIEFIQDTIDATIGPVIDTITNAIGNYIGKIASAAMAAESEYKSTGYVSSSTISNLTNAILGDIFWVLVGAVTAVSIAIIAIQLGTMGFGFLISLAMENIASILIVTAIGAAMATMAYTGIGANIADWLIDLIAGEGGNVSAGSMVSWGVDLSCGILDTIFSAAQMMYISGACKGLVIGLLSLVISTFGAAFNSLLLDVIGLALGAYSLYEVYKNKASLVTLPDPSASEINMLSGIVTGSSLFFGLGNLLYEGLDD